MRYNFVCTGMLTFLELYAYLRVFDLIDTRNASSNEQVALMEG